MKLATLLLFTLFLSQSWGQLSSSQRWEKAQFEVKVQEKRAFTTTFLIKENLTKSEFLELERIMLEKEGIIEVESTKSNEIVISHMELVDFQTLKEFILMFRQEFSSEERQEIKFD